MLQRKKRRMEVRSVIRTWLISYLSVLAIPLAASLLLFLAVSALITRETEHANLLELQIVQENLDNLIERSDLIAYELNENANVNALRTLERDDVRLPYLAMDAYQQLSRHSSMSNYVARIHLYYRKSNLVVTGNSVLTLEDYLLYAFPYTEMDASTARGLIQSKGAGTLFTFTGGDLQYKQTIPLLGHTDDYCTLFLEYDMDQVLYLSGSDEDMVILNSGGELLYVSNPAFSGLSLDASVLSGESGTCVETIGGQSYHLMFVSSSRTGLILMKAIPAARFAPQLTYVKMLGVGSFLLCVLLGFAASVLLVRRNYKPVREIVNILCGDGKDGAASKNEFTYMKQAIDSLLEDRTSHRNAMQLHEESMRRQFLLNLFYGIDRDELYVTEMADKLGVPLEASCFLLAAIRFDRDMSEDNGLFGLWLLENVFTELLQDYELSAATGKDDTLYLLFNREAPYESQKEKICAQLQTGVDFFREKYAFSLCAAAASSAQGKEDLHRLFQQVQDGLAHDSFDSGCDVRFFASGDRGGHGYAYNKEMENSLVSLLKRGEIAEANRLLQQLFEKKESGGYVSMSEWKHLAIHIMGSVFQILEQKNSSSRYLQQKNPYEKIEACQDSASLKQTIRELMDGLRPFLETQDGQGEENLELSGRAIAFIHEHYGDSNLCNAMIAEHLRVNVTYLSSEFKRQTGEGLQEYITNFRLELSTQRLCSTNFTIEKIARDVGIENSRTYLRNFKKKYGISPTQFRTFFLQEKEKSNQDAEEDG